MKKEIKTDYAIAAPDSGKILTLYFKQKRTRKSLLSRLMNISLTSLNYHTRQSSIHTHLLWHMSLLLKHNFFAEYAAALPADFSSSVPLDNTKDDKIAQLERRIEILEAEKAVLISVMKVGV